MPRKETHTGQISAQAQQDQVSEGIENFELPKSLVTKIAKSAIPDNTKLQKETILSLVKGSTVFINYLAATAHDVALSKQHKSISASDVLKALEIIELGDMTDKLQAELQIYREQSKNGKKAASTTSKIKVATSASAPLPAKPSKGKEKEKVHPPATAHAPIPIISGPLPEHVSSVSALGAAMDVDEEAELDRDEEVMEDEIDEEDDVPEDVDEELQDIVALEEEPMKDAKGLDEPGTKLIPGVAMESV